MDEIYIQRFIKVFTPIAGATFDSKRIVIIVFEGKQIGNLQSIAD